MWKYLAKHLKFKSRAQEREKNGKDGCKSYLEWDDASTEPSQERAEQRPLGIFWHRGWIEDRIQERRVISSHQRCRTRSGRVPWKLRVPRTKRVTAQNVMGAASKVKTKKKPRNVAIELQRVTATGDGDGSCTSSEFPRSKCQDRIGTQGIWVVGEGGILVKNKERKEEWCYWTRVQPPVAQEFNPER